ncbi:hypothetical protein HPP92_009092 [Vanilla planifolia]|uniref:K Homology domain-containing protein n=1 Tax=Vanilla planifolia TaxID=51239 RepID=A0A835V6A4_VANPL|nr:hypothetical protein HPP92_009092 [Vanilla planifolia]
MTDAEAAVVVESGVSEGNEVPLPVKETNLEEPEVVGEGSPTVADEEEETHGTPGLKRKLENLDHSQNEEAPAKKLEICQAELELEESGQTTDEATETSKLVIQGSEEQLQNNDSGCPTTEKHIEEPDAVVLGSSEVDGNVEEVQKGQNGGPDETGVIQDEMEAETLGNGQVSSTCNQHSSVDDTKDSISAPHLDGLPLTGEQSSLDHTTSSRKIEIPNNKVGVLIGKSGETIRYLQMNSGAKIQITRDADSDPESSTRPVELIGSLENISKAEQLIKDVIAEADAGGSPALVARGFNTPHSGGEQTEIQVPNEKVGMIIGKGGETIKNLQTKTGARIQLLPQHLSERDSSKVRTIRITGNKKQVESAKEMIKDVMNQIWLYLSHEINVGMLVYQ